MDLAYHGPNHSPGNIFTYLPTQRVLMLVDVVFPGWVPFAYLAESQNIPGWLEAPAQALSYPFHTLIGGHLTRLGTGLLDRSALYGVLAEIDALGLDLVVVCQHTSDPRSSGPCDGRLQLSEGRSSRCWYRRRMPSLAGQGRHYRHEEALT
jgi:glyoxylase-like metal-dependent hydrolase (beta-lactamase superfamily II)